MHDDDSASESAAYTQWKGWEADGFGHCHRHEQRYFDWHVRRAVGSEPAMLRVLELGFGNGQFLGHCRQRGWDVHGIEPNAELRARADRAHFTTAATVHDLPPGPGYDLIALFDVLEHVPVAESTAFLTSLGDRLAADGAILLRVPNGDSPFGGRHQHGDMTHVSTYGEFSLKQLAQLAGLKVVAIGEAPWNAQQSEGRTPSSFRRALTRSLINRLFGYAYFGNPRIDFGPNLAAVLVLSSSARPGIP